MKSVLVFVLFLSLICAANAQTREISVEPTVDTAAYASGDTVGGLITISGISCPGEMLEVSGIKTVDNAGQSTTRDFVFYKTQPTGTFTDNAATAPTKADLIAASPPIQVKSTDCFVFSGKSICSLSSLSSQIRSSVLFNSQRRIWLTVTTRGADDFVLATDFSIQLYLRCK